MGGMQQWNQAQGLLGGIMQGQLGISENIAQSDIARQQMEMQLQMQNQMMNQQAVTGLIDAGMSFIPGMP